MPSSTMSSCRWPTRGRQDCPDQQKEKKPKRPSHLHGILPNRKGPFITGGARRATCESSSVPEALVSEPPKNRWVSAAAYARAWGKFGFTTDCFPAIA